MGETSGAAIRALSLGKPLVVSDLGWFAELPDDVALRVPVDERRAETLLAALGLVASRPDVGAAMSRPPRLARTDHDVDARRRPLRRRDRGGRRRAAVQESLLREVARPPPRSGSGRRPARVRAGRAPAGGRACPLRRPRRRGVASARCARAVPVWAWLTGDRRRLRARPLPALARDGRPVDLRRRARSTASSRRASPRPGTSPSARSRPGSRSASSTRC